MFYRGISYSKLYKYYSEWTLIIFFDLDGEALIEAELLFKIAIISSYISEFPNEI